jgi:hypothetical protein
LTRKVTKGAPELQASVKFNCRKFGVERKEHAGVERTGLTTNKVEVQINPRVMR